MANKFKNIFISYAKADKYIAGELKRYLEKYDFDVFVAHDDIEGGDLWMADIIDRLKKTDIFIPLYSQNFEKSEWTYQECGGAIVADAEIYPISLDGVTFARGFINRHQAMKLEQYPEITFIKLIKKFASKKNTYWRDRMIEKLNTFGSFNETREVFNIYESFDYDKKSINKFVKNCANNGQVFDTFNARPIIRKLMDKYKKVINKSLFKDLMSKIDR